MANNQRSHGQMDMTVRTRASNRSIYDAELQANGSWGMFYGGAFKVGNVFACGERRNDGIDKRIPPLDRAHRIGLSIMSKERVTVLENVLWGRFEKQKNRKNRRRFRSWGALGMRRLERGSGFLIRIFLCRILDSASHRKSYADFEHMRLRFAWGLCFVSAS
jgi:hypothetical protein